MTYSVVARCPRTHQYGIGIATYSPGVGSRCPVVVPSCGALSLQAVYSPQLETIAARLLAEGSSAERVVHELRAADPYPEYRQIAVVDVYGRAHASTGKKSPSWSGHEIGDGFACAGNVLAGPVVTQAMRSTFEATAGLDLAERLVRAIEAGRDAGGQPEGQSSAALLVFDRYPFPIVDLRVDLHDEPERELRRLWDFNAPMVPYYIERAFSPMVPRWWQWRQEHVAGWTARHLN